jgi:serine/threonine protein kinase
MIKEGKLKVYGVLMDFDLSSWKDALKGDYTMTSQQRTGTPPYMAHELLLGTSGTHLYRHDLESLFYVMLLTAARHTVGSPKKGGKRRLIMRKLKMLPFHGWFDQINYETLGSLKGAFLADKKALSLAKDFKDFHQWLKFLQRCFHIGFKKQPSSDDDEVQDWEAGLIEAERGPPDFDDETLGGCITYSTMIAPARHLGGKLKGLIIRDPQHPLLPEYSRADAAR